MLTFTKDFTLQEPIPDEGIANALEVLRSGRLHRYNVCQGETGFAAKLEEAFAAYMGKSFCLACASCGSAMYIALKSAGVQNGDKVLCNAYTLAPVPGAIFNAGAEIVLIETTEEYTIDLDDLDAKAANSGARFLLLSHMRGHITDMDRVTAICRKHGLLLIEDCAHTMGALWDGKKSGSFGVVACFSTQTYKHMNSGEGGLLVTDDPRLIARGILYSGSYMLYPTHVSKPPLDVFEELKLITPNYSSRMDNLRAALLLPQLERLDEQSRRWNILHDAVASGLRSIPGLTVPERDAREYYVGSSIQFSLREFSRQEILVFLDETEKRGVQIKWFGGSEPVGFTSAYKSWRYFGSLPDLPRTMDVLSTMCDMRLPLTFTEEDCTTIVSIIRETAHAICNVGG